MAANHDHELIPDPTGQQTSDDPAERRRYFRVEDHIILEYALLADGEREHVIKTLRDDHPSRHLIASSFASTSQQMQYVLRRIQEREPEIALYLQTLNEKLDLLARQLAMESTELTDQTPRRVDISASGACFEAAQPMEPGQLVDLKMLLFPSLDYIRSVGRVVRCAETTEAQQESAFSIAVDFDYLRDDDRELLVQHVVKKQSSQLRAERPDLPDD